MIYKIPTIEEVYNEYHKQTFYIQHGVYPKAIQNFDNLYKDERKIQILKYFLTFLEKNRVSVDWKLYILSLAKVFRNRFDLKYLRFFSAEIRFIEIM